MKVQHTDILKRAWQILWQYRALWVFGIILAITTVSAGGRSQYSVGDSDRRDGIQAGGQQTGQFDIDPRQPIWPQVAREISRGFGEAAEEIAYQISEANEDEITRTVLRITLWVIGIMLVLFLVGRVLRYVVEVSLISMVDDHEQTGEKRSAREGWRMGWSHHAWQMFLSDLVIDLPVAVVFILLFAAAISPTLISLATSPENVQGWLGLVASIGLVLILALVAIIVAAILSLVKPFIRREVVLSDLNSIAGIRKGFQMAKKYWKDTGLMWLILKGIDLVFPLVLLPFGILSGGLGLLLGGGVALLFGGRAIESGDPAMVWPILAGIILFVIVFAIPVAFVNGLRSTYQSSSWTLTFRELKAVQSLENGDSAVEVPA